MKMKTKTRVRLVGGFGIALVAVSFIYKLIYCLKMPSAVRLDSTILLGIIIGFSFIHSAGLIELRGKIESLEKKR
jgi:hypothetical protein